MSATIQPQYIKFPAPERETKEHDCDDFRHKTREHDTDEFRCWRKPETVECRKPVTGVYRFDNK